MKDVKVFDNGGESFDRYTVIIDESVFGMSHNPRSPQGFNQYCGEKDEFPEDLSHLGEDITENYLSLPHELFVAIWERVNI